MCELLIDLFSDTWWWVEERDLSLLDKSEDKENISRWWEKENETGGHELYYLRNMLNFWSS